MPFLALFSHKIVDLVVLNLICSTGIEPASSLISLDRSSQFYWVKITEKLHWMKYKFYAGTASYLKERDISR